MTEFWTLPVLGVAISGLSHYSLKGWPVQDLFFLLDSVTGKFRSGQIDGPPYMLLSTPDFILQYTGWFFFLAPP